MILDVHDLNVVFQTGGRKLHAVRGLNFSIQEGEIVGIVGESGCGKSATAKALLRLLPSHSSTVTGKINYEGKDLNTYSEAQMQEVRGKELSMIFQDPMTSLNPTLKIGTQIVEGYLKHFPKVSLKDAWQHAEELLYKVGIPDPKTRIHAYPHTLSGGMRQRAMIALALACRPKILLADEPTTALDVTIQAQILDLMKTLQKETGTSIVLITHDLGVVAHFCDRVMVMYGGKIVEAAPVEELFASPQHPYTKRLLQAIPRLDKSRLEPLIPIEGTPPTLTEGSSGCSFCPRCSDAMHICMRQTPPLFDVTSVHKSACFQHDPRKEVRS